MGQFATEQQSESYEPDIKKLPPRRRHTYLHGRYRWNHLRCQPPYNETPIHFVEDLMWIARRRGWRIITPSSEGVWLAQRARALKSRLRREPTFGSAPDLRGAVFDHVDLSHLDLSGARLEGATFTQCRLDGTKFINADLRGAHFEGVDLSGAILLDDNQEKALRSQLPAHPGATPIGTLVPIHTRNELLWIVSHGYNLQLVDLREADVYERDLDGLDLAPDSVASAAAFALVGSIAKNLIDDKSPFTDVTVRTWRDLLWLKLASAAGTLPVTIPLDKLSDLRNARLSGGDFKGANLFRADLRNAKLLQVVLDAADLSYANLSETEMNKTSARGANLVCADLVRTRLYDAHLDGANLLEARLRYARLDNASLRGATLSVSDLRAATFRDAVLECVDLRGARVNAATSFIDATISKGTQWGDVVFHSTPLLEINWRNAKTLGDESDLYLYDYVKRSAVRIQHYRDVMRAYRQMYAKLYDQGFYGPARRYRLREKALVRKQLWEYRHFRDWFYSRLAYLLFGYGELPGRLLILYFAVIGLFTLIYYALAHRILPFLPPYRSDQITWVQAGVLSASTFRGEPGFPSVLLQQHYIGTLLSVLGAAETAIGTVILLAMTLLWARRLFGNETPVVEVDKRRWRRRIARGFRRTREHSVVPPTPSQDTS